MPRYRWTPQTDIAFEENEVGGVYTFSRANQINSGYQHTYSLSGADADAFTIDDDGNLILVAPLDYESPTDADLDGTYDVTITATYANWWGWSFTARESVSLEVADVVAYDVDLRDPDSVSAQGLPPYEPGVEFFGTSEADNIHASDHNDLVDLGGGDDWLEALIGNDTVYGGDGNDTIYGNFGNDLLFGGDGDDVVAANGHDDVAYGGLGDDIVKGGGGKDLVYGDDGDDRVEGGRGDDQVFGGDGNDVLIGGTGNDILSGGDGDDLMTGDSGADTFLFSDADVSGHDAATDFDVVNDLVDVSGTYANWGAVQAALSDDLNGDAVLTAGAASLTLQGIAAAQLTEDMFLF